VSATYFQRVSSLKSVEAFQEHLRSLNVHIPVERNIESAPASPLAQKLVWRGHSIGNRWCILPMEGWDGTDDGRPSELTRRRWAHFGQSGAKLIWGGEAVAVCHEGRANPNQLWIREETAAEFASLREHLVEAHLHRFHRDDDLLVGLQLTHSGRFCRPYRKDRMEPKILYHHPILDPKFGIPSEYPLFSDDEIRRLIDRFIEAARLAWKCGYSFVDLKHCHGYLGHEFLSAVERRGVYGGSFENRTRFLKEIVEGIRAAVPRLEIVVRLSAFDMIPFRKTDEGHGIPERSNGEYRFGFGCDPEHPTNPALRETEELIQLLEQLEIDLVCTTAGSPYYNPHIHRPAIFPPSDGYDPPEDPLVGVARQIEVTAQLKRRFPKILMVGSAYSYLQEYLPHVAQAAVRAGNTDFIGLGRMVLAYPDLPADVIEGHPLKTSRLCRTFSDCTTGPRHGLISGCFPLDPYYQSLAEAAQLKAIKSRLKRRD
jgi:NADPH2 dehydrogenase